jgi:hypothetical protein
MYNLAKLYENTENYTEMEKSIDELTLLYQESNNKIGILTIYTKTKDIIDTLQNLEIPDKDMPNSMKIIKKLLVQQMDIMKLHFDYTIYGKGYEEAKLDFINLVSYS